MLFNLIFQRSITSVGYAWTARIMGLVALGGFVIALPMVLCRTVHPSGKRRSIVDVRAWKELPFLTLCIGGFFRFLGYFSPMFFIPVFAQTALGLSQHASLDILIALNAASFFGRLLGPLAAARTIIVLPWFLCSVTAGALCLAWLGIHTVGGFIAFAVLYGLISAPLTVFPPAAVPLLCPTPSVIGTRMGMLWGSTAFAFLVGTPIAAAISDTTNGHFLGLQIFSGMTQLVGALLLLPLWVPIRKQQQKANVSVTSEKT